MNVAHYISELLYRHECVVVPGFGAFVSAYAPAKVHPAQHTFTPPSKQIIFNKHLQQNDGLLAQTIVNEAKCSFDDAMKAIRDFSEDINRRLKRGEKCELHNLGRLSFDPEGNYVFEADADVNYLIDSFGLSSFQSMPIIREEAAEKRKPVEKIDRVVPEERKEIIEKVILERPRRGRGVLITSAVVLPLLVAGLWFTSVKTNALAGFGIFSKKESSLYHSSKLNLDIKGSSTPDLVPDNSGIAKFSLAENAPDIIVNIHKVVPDSTLVAKAQQLHIQLQASSGASFSGHRFFVIAGAFAIPENAEKFRRMLSEKGYDSQIVERLSSKLTHIGVGSFDSKEDAEAFVSKVSGSIPGVWILKK